MAILREFYFPQTTTWFCKMDTCVPLDLLAAGNNEGEV